MGTRCSTYFTDAKINPIGMTADPLNRVLDANVFRHWDGYPTQAGADIQRFLKLDARATEGTRVGDSSMLAARYVAFLAHEFNAGGRQGFDYASGERTKATGRRNPCDFLSVRIDKPVLGSAPDVEFEYLINGSGETFVREACYGYGTHAEQHGEWETLQVALDRDREAVNA